MIYGKRKGLFGLRQKCPSSLRPTPERAAKRLADRRGGVEPRDGWHFRPIRPQQLNSHQYLACEQALCLKKGWKKREERKGKGFFHPFPKQRAWVPDSLRSFLTLGGLARNILLEAVHVYRKLQTNLSGLFEIRRQDVWTWTCSFFLAWPANTAFPPLSSPPGRPNDQNSYLAPKLRGIK